MAQLTAIYVWRTPGADEAAPALVAAARSRLAALYPGVPVYSNLPASDVIVAPGALVAGLRRALADTAATPEDSAALFYDWHPLLDADLTREIAADHFKHRAHFTFGENIPPGFAPDFASREFLDELPESAPDALRELTLKEIDRFDVELFYKLPDLRQFRLDFSLKSARSRRLAADALARAPDLRFDTLAAFVKNFPAVLRPAPSWIELELCASAGAGLKPDWILPDRQGREERMSAALVDRIIGEAQPFALARDVSWRLGVHGEPLLHSDCLAIVERLLALETTAMVYLETYGLELTDAARARLQALPGRERLTVIVKLNTLRPDRYRKMYGADRLAEALTNLDRLAEAPGERGFAAFVEMLRLKETEDEVQNFFDRFEKTGVTPILQKYNSFAGRLPERRAADLRPLHRDFCWHLARDVQIDASGRAPLCKQDPPGSDAFFVDLNKTSLTDFWARTQVYFEHSVRGEHAEIPAPCLQCDEWYTFNG